MSEWMDAILGLKKLSTGAADVQVSFGWALPAWAWALMIAGAFVLAGVTYSRLLGPRLARWALAIVRATLLVLIALLLCQPRLTRQSERVERDWVLVMADRSASMTVADIKRADTRASRETQLREALDTARPTFASIAKTRGLLFLGFDAGVFELAAEPETGPVLGPARGQRTAIGQSLDQALRRVAARPLAGIVLLSDGRSTDAVSRATIRQLEARGASVFVVPLGSPSPMVDLAVARVDAPGAAFAGDIVPVGVRIDRLGGDGPTRGRVQLVDEVTGLVLDDQPFEATAPSTELTLTSRPEAAAREAWSVRVVPETPDLTGENNSAPVRIEVVDRPIRAVYFDGYPRWEYRYLKNLLVREASIRSSTLLLAADRKYIQEGTEPLASVPRTAVEWNEIDVIVLGDVRPTLFSEDQLRQIRTLIAERGAGLLWVGGAAATPNAWRGTALADLLPFTLATDSGESIQSWDGPVLLKPGPAAARFGVMRLGDGADATWPAALASADLGWPQFHWAQRIPPASLKPTTEVLGVAQPSLGEPSATTPLIMTMRYGAGRVAYVGTDESWRYRYGRGETLPERLWIPLIRLLARESLGRSGKPAILSASPERAQEGQPIQVTVRLIDQALIERRPTSVRVNVIPEGLVARGTELVLRPESPSEDGGSAGAFSATWVPAQAGSYRIEPADALLAGLDLAARVDVALPDDELRLPQTNHPYLATLATETGGQILSPERLSDLPDLLPNRQLRLLGAPETEDLWDKPVIWAALMLLMALEWMGRRLIKLA
ncbi:hypothetical protein PHYC_02551 [Phycisphaerales bacterium]|nr:hypothetical protein PHYC_02551 [Phycisphaerales bacterium]